MSLPLAVDDEVLSETSEGVQPPGTHSQLDGFVHSLGFFDLLGDVLSAFYIPAEEQSSSRMSLETQLPSPLSTTLELNSRLDEFLGNLPHHLQLHREINLSGIPDTGFFELQARTLHFRSLYLRILLLRPYVLSRIQHGCNQDLVTNSKFISVLEQRVSTELIQLCLSTAHTVINNLHDQIYGSNPSPSWHAVYCKALMAHQFSSAELEFHPNSNFIVLTLCLSCLRCCYSYRGSITLFGNTLFLRSSRHILG